MSAILRIAVAGAGLIGTAHMKRIAAEPDLALAAIIDPAPAARARAEALSVPWFADIAEALAASRPDGIIVATPNHLHVPQGLAAIAAGIPALVEKPVSTDTDSAMRLVAASEAARVPILVGHHRRHSPLVQRARAIVQSGRLGTIAAVNGMALFRKPDHGYFDGANAWRREKGGGVVLINLIHVIDDLRNVCGDIVGVQAMQSNAARGFAVEDTAAILLRFANGALGTLTLSDTVAAPWSWELTSGEDKAFPGTDQFCYLVAGTKGSLTIPRLDVWSHEGDGWWTPIRAERSVVPEQDPLTLQLRHFRAVIRGEASPLLDAREATRTLETTLAVSRAAGSGGIVTLS
ncbi:MAG: Gfo/Idh/MocA family oxidoreductase [Rhodospirillales bacterium]|nr:Gfo/Idh/MocA family oxidoreductase [Rhodospirillales bacterium]